MDSENLSQALSNLHFSVSIYKDCSRRDLLEAVREAATVDHADYDCLLVAILSHGEHGYIYSRDSHYKLDEVTSYFTADRCPSLAGKPKVCEIIAFIGISMLSAGNIQLHSLSEQIPVRS